MDRHRTALLIVASALALGLAGDVLLRYTPWGVNAFLWCALFLGGVALARRTPPAALPSIGAIVGALSLAWRDSPVLVVLDVLLLATFLPMLAAGARGVKLVQAGLAEIGGAMAITALQSVAGPPQLLFRDLSWSKLPQVSVRGAGVLLRGTLLAVPALLVFGALLVAADEKFERVVLNLIFFDADELFLHVIATSVIAAICAGFLRSLALAGPMPQLARPAFLRLATSETNVALTLISVLFAAFVFVQFRYFFSAPETALSQYARRGFFELVAVVALVLPMLLLLEWLIDKEDAHRLRVFRGLATMQIALVFVIAASAYRRMQLYRDEFGLTRLRFFTTAFMIWLAVLLVWFVLTVLTGRRRHFAVGTLVTGVAAVVILHAINPDALIVETNLERAAIGQRPFDAAYAASLSDDAAKVILANADTFGPSLDRFTGRSRTIGWRTWNLSRARASRAIREIGRVGRSRAI